MCLLVSWINRHQYCVVPLCAAKTDLNCRGMDRGPLEVSGMRALSADPVSSWVAWGGTVEVCLHG